MARLLTEDEMIELTGYQVPVKQLEALKALGLRPIIRPDGRPRITDDALTQAMLGRTAQAESPAASPSPDWTKIRKRA